MTSRRTSILAGTILLVGIAVAAWFMFRPRTEPADENSHALKIQSASYKAPLVIAVQAVYPGANAQTVAATVAAPIEQQVNGVEHMLSMSSQSANDGSYTLHVTFKEGTDLDMAKVLMQNRVSLALPQLPGLVQQEGIAVRKLSPQPLVLVSLTSPDLLFDHLFLSNYAIIQIKNELARLPGVGDVVLFGQRDSRMHVALDVDKLTSLQLSALDVVTAINQQNIQVAGPIGQAPVPQGQPFRFTMSTLGRLAAPEQFESVIVKVTADGRTVRLKDVARVELGSNERNSATLNGKPAVLLGIYPLPNAKPSDVSRAVCDKLAELRANVPEGLALASPFDFAPNLEDPNNPATPEYLVIDVELPDSATSERTVRILERTAELVRKTPGVQDVLTLTEHPFSLVRSRPCLVVRLAPKDKRVLGREQIAGKVRVALQNQIPDATFRLSVPSTVDGFPVYGFAIEFAIEDRGDYGRAILLQKAEELVEKMSRSGKFSDVGVGFGLRHAPYLNMNIDRTKCLALGVEMSDIFNTMQVYLGSYYVNNFNQFGRTWQVIVQVDPRFRDRTADILKLQVKNKQNQLVRLGTVMDLSDTVGPMVVERHNMYPVARITANLTEGVALPEAKTLCETLAEQEFGTKQFKLIWRTR